MLEKKTTKELYKWIDNLYTDDEYNLNKLWVSQESLVKFILRNYTIERRGGQGITNKNRPKRLIDVELLFNELKGEKEC